MVAPAPGKTPIRNPMIDWRPMTLDIPSFLGSAKTDGKGKVLESKRSPSQWAAVKYAYRDAKRTARARGLTLKGPTKIWDSSLASIGLMWAKDKSLAGLLKSTELAVRRALKVVRQ